MAFDSRIIAFANFIAPIDPMVNASDSVIVAWHAGGSPYRATTYMSSPGQVFATGTSPLQSARDFLFTFFGGLTGQIMPEMLGPARASWDRFNAKLSDYTTAVLDYVRAGNVQWRPPFPQTIAGLWRDLLASYINTWASARALARMVISLSSGATSATSAVPPKATVSPTSIVTATTTPSMVNNIPALTPSAQAQVLGTQVAAVAPVTGGAGVSPTLTVPTAAAQASATMTAAGEPVQVQNGSGTPAGLPMVHTPLYKMPAFWVAIGGSALLLGGGYYFFVRK